MKELKLDVEDYRDLIAVQRKIADLLNAINRAGDPPQGFLVAIALMRLAANLLNMYPPEKRDLLIKLGELVMEHSTLDPKELHKLMPRVTLH